ncbi:hypothetical protein I503_03982 [Candida albicans SC5314]|nr:hypothetical protein W5Q_03957 [Candida albicans SC5314]KHC86294.1 hypothetical protein I503_03982 [Candida albicans SC5314]
MVSVSVKDSKASCYIHQRRIVSTRRSRHISLCYNTTNSIPLNSLRRRFKQVAGYVLQRFQAIPFFVFSSSPRLINYPLSFWYFFFCRIFARGEISRTIEMKKPIINSRV